MRATTDTRTVQPQRSRGSQRIVCLGVLCALCGLTVSVPLVAQGLVTERSLSLPLARTIAEAALAECKGKGFATAVAVVDRGGDLLVVLRDERATPQTVEMARRKAYTARMFKMT